MQQTYCHFYKGLTKDPRFAQFIHAVPSLNDQANLAIERGYPKVNFWMAERGMPYCEDSFLERRFFASR